MSTDPSQPPERTPTGRLAEATLHRIVGYQIVQANIAMQRVFADKVGEPYDLRPVEFTILALIDENPGASAKALAQALAVTAPNITVWIDRLEGRGLVKRERSETDRRAQHIRATVKGSRLARQSAELLKEAEHDALKTLSEGERSILVELLHKVARCRQR
jgi:DNA-binding MarR family transcriptional regulator